MPTIKRFALLRIRMYADDHLPPHFHVTHPDFEVLVGIEDLRILRGHAVRRDIREALDWAQENTALLMRSWDDLNRRG